MAVTFKKTTPPRTLEDINRAIAVPGKITTDDGREIKTTSWKPVSKVGEIITVTIEAQIVFEPEPETA